MKKIIGILLVCILGTTIFMESTHSTAYAASKKVELTFETKEFVADKNGSATIKGTTSKKAKLKIDKKKVEVKNDGSFEYNYKLKKTDDSKRVSVIATLKGSKKNKQKVTIISYKKNEDKKNEQEKKNKKSADQKEEVIEDITKLADEPTIEQQTILDTLAQQEFDNLYPYKGSKMHTILGTIQPWTQKDGKWYRKVEATIVNAYGAKSNANVEIHITPVSSNSGDVEIITY